MSDQWGVGGWDGWMDGYTTVDGYALWVYIYLYIYKNILFNCPTTVTVSCVCGLLLVLFFFRRLPDYPV